MSSVGYTRNGERLYFLASGFPSILERVSTTISVAPSTLTGTPSFGVRRVPAGVITSIEKRSRLRGAGPKPLIFVPSGSHFEPQFGHSKRWFTPTHLTTVLSLTHAIIKATKPALVLLKKNCPSR